MIAKDTELIQQVWTEKFRPSTFDDLIFDKKQFLLTYLERPSEMPSFIFHSSPGTGKTTCAKLIAQQLKSDLLLINASDERGVDTIREKVKDFVMSMSLNESVKKCVFMDESDGMTKIAFECLRNLMETYSDNAFFIFSANDVNKIPAAIQSRCVMIDFSNPCKTAIFARLQEICEQENLKDLLMSEGLLERYVDSLYPDIRKMIVNLYRYSLEGGDLLTDEKEFEDFLILMKNKQVSKLYEIVSSGTFSVMEFNKWLFKRLFNNFENIGLVKASKIAYLLADTEKSWNMNVTLDIVFMSNLLKIVQEL